MTNPKRTATKKRGLTVGSVQHWQSTFELGEVRWKPTTLERFRHDQRELNGAKSRRVECMKDRTFVVGLYTAVSSSKAGDIHYLVRVERVE